MFASEEMKNKVSWVQALMKYAMHAYVYSVM